MTGPSAAEKQAHAILHELDELYDGLMDRAEQANNDGAYDTAHIRAMQAHSVLKALRVVQRVAGISPVVWENIHRREGVK